MDNKDFPYSSEFLGNVPDSSELFGNRIFAEVEISEGSAPTQDNSDEPAITHQHPAEDNSQPQVVNIEAFL